MRESGERPEIVELAKTRENAGPDRAALGFQHGVVTIPNRCGKESGKTPTVDFELSARTWRN